MENFSTLLKISDSSNYEGKWVIILDEKVVASDTSEEIKHEMEQIRKEHPNEIPLVAKVPKRIMQTSN